VSNINADIEQYREAERAARARYPYPTPNPLGAAGWAGLASALVLIVFCSAGDIPLGRHATAFYVTIAITSGLTYLQFLYSRKHYSRILNEELRKQKETADA
jgi:hypothetical protein